MVHISKNFLVTMNSGDTFRVPLFINIGDKLNPRKYLLKGGEYIDNSMGDYYYTGDEVWFAIGEPNQPFECALVRKIFTSADMIVKPEDPELNGMIMISLDSSDTEHIVPGEYYMEIKIKLANGQEKGSQDDAFSTITPKRKFIIL